MTSPKRDAIVNRAIKARYDLDRFKRSTEHVRKYSENDPDTVEWFNERVRWIAEGTEVAKVDIAVLESKRSGVPIPPDVNAEAAAWRAEQQEFQAMQADPEFAKRLARGDLAAARAMRDHNERLAILHGLDPAVARGTTQETVAQGTPSGAGSVATGSAAS